MSIPAPKLSIVIISWNSRPLLEKCLEALSSGGYPFPHETVWVDNGSTDGAKEMLAEHWPEVRRVILPENRGVAYARNRGLEQCRGEYVLFLDDDTEASPEVVTEMVAYLDSTPDAGLCAAALADAAGIVQDSCKPFPGLGVKIRNVLGRKRDEEMPKEEFEPCYVIGACQMFRREITETIGELDEHIFYGPEDADFCIRVRRAGWRVVYLPHLRILHHWQRATRRNPLGPLGRKHIRALLYFYRKHRRWL